MIQRRAREIAKNLPAGRLTVVSLCSGQGDKDRILLKALKEVGKELSYLAIDASEVLLKIALKRVRTLKIPSQGLLADIEEARLPGSVRARCSPPRLFLLLGNTLGGFDPIRLSRHLKKFLGDDDFLLVDGEIFAGEKTLAGYDHPVNRRFAWGPLKSLGIRETGGDLRFEIRRDKRRRGLFFVHKYFASKKGKVLPMSPSYKYLPTTFRNLLRNEMEVQIIQEYWSRDRRLLMILGKKSMASPRRSAS